MKEESRIVEETRQKIASGELTYDQMKEKLIVAIDKEYEKEGEPDVELINACEELLAELATDGQPLLESHQEKYGEVIRNNIQVSHYSRNRGGFAKRLAVSLVVLVLLLGGGQVFLHREWFELGTTDNEQQHTIQGFVVDPGLVAKAIADNSSETRILSTNNYNEVRAFLGFELPTNVFLNGWDISVFRIVVKPWYIKCTIMYTQMTNDNTIMVQLNMFSSKENAYESFEQNNNGITIMKDGNMLHHSSNIDNNTIFWIDGNCIWRCYGNVDDNQLFDVVEMILGGNSNE